MAKAKPRTVRSNRHPSGDDTVRRFVEGPVRTTLPVQRTVQAGSVDVDARTLTAVVATGAGRIMEVWDDDLDAYIVVEEVLDIAGMGFDRVASGMQFLDNHNSWDRDANLGVVLEARVEDLGDDVGNAVVVDVKMSSRSELDSLVQDLADGIVGCISCQYRPIESTLELRDGQHPLLTHTKSELLEVSLVSVPADPHALVRSETSLKGQNMAPKPKTVQRSAAAAKPAGTQQRSDDTTLDEATIEEIVAAAIAEATPQIVEETLTAARAEGEIVEMTDEEKAAAEKAEAEAKKKEDEEAAAGGGDTSVRSLVRSAVAKALGRSSPPEKKAGAELTQLRSVAAKYGLGGEFDDMKTTGASHAELRSFVLNATASRSGTGQTFDGRNRGDTGNELTWANSNRGRRAAERAARR
ncbi:HK97 family phage prohead protease [Pelagibacterium sp.]|uniref:HK97 family phage prohead protease n=1 Tax=Pelagibacterium sp. TaxID=1967288 RepID=UPI003A9585B8